MLCIGDIPFTWRGRFRLGWIYQEESMRKEGRGGGGGGGKGRREETDRW